MSYEVEQKYPLFSTDDVEGRLVGLGAEFQEPVQQADQYFAHPVRDFGQTDEALRIRCVGEATVLTYKGPKLDPTTKTRREIETPLGATTTSSTADSAAQLADTLTLLGFTPVLQVRKKRRSTHLSWKDHTVEIALDDVEGLGSFLELEILAEEDGLDAARGALQSLSKHLGLPPSDRRSYLELLLQKMGNPPEGE